MRRSTTLLLSLVTASSLVLVACGDDDTTSTDMPRSDSGMDGTMGGPMGGDGATGHDESSAVADGAAVTARLVVLTGRLAMVGMRGRSRRSSVEPAGVGTCVEPVHEQERAGQERQDQQCGPARQAQRAHRDRT